MFRLGRISGLRIAAVGMLLWVGLAATAELANGLSWLQAILSLGMLLVVPLGLANGAASVGAPLPKWLIPVVVAAGLSHPCRS